MDMFQSDRHEPLAGERWNEAAARGAIREIADSTRAQFDPEKLWPAHPLDGVPGGIANIYFGAMGTILALDHLKRAGAISYSDDFGAAIPGFVERDNVWLKNTPFGAYGSLLMGDMGTHFAAMRVKPDDAHADRVFERAAGNDDLPLLELMWGTPGSLLACVLLHRLTGETRFETLYRKQAARLIDGVEQAGSCRVWAQEMYGQRKRYLGLVHGFAGNVLALFKGWQWLSSAQQKTAAELATQMLSSCAKRVGKVANWPSNADEPDAPMLCQICHGAPGIVAAFADAPFSSPEFEALLVAGGKLIWAAGPLKKGSNFCHGTAGNAYALLKLYKRTRNSVWLDRARAFAMTGIAQRRAAHAEYGQDRYSLWTGDPGLAICLWSCVTANPQFPGLDAI